MASSLPPVKGAAFSFETALVSTADTDIFKAGPTLAAGDVKVIKDGTYDDNIDSLPTAVTSCTNVITVALSATEMNADRVTVVFHDASGDEWQDTLVTIYTAAQTLDTTDGIADDIKATVNHADYGNAKLVRSTTPANTLDVSATGEAGLDFANIKDATGAHTLTNITVPVVTTVGTTTNLTNLPAAAALEATLTDLKGAGYTNTTDTLEKIRDAIPAAAPSAADVADAVWDEAVADHAGVGSTGEALAGATAPTAAAVADAVWDEMSTGHTDAGKAGQQLWTDIDAIKAKADLLDVTGTPTVVSLVDGGDLTVIAGATFDPPTITGQTIPATWTTGYFTVKARKETTGNYPAADATALIQIKVSNPAAAGDGLLYLNAAAASSAALGSLALDATAGTVTIVLADDATVLLAKKSGYYWDIKTLNTGGTSDVVCSGTLDVVLTPTKTV